MLAFFFNKNLKLESSSSNYSKYFQEGGLKLFWDSIVIMLATLVAIEAPIVILFEIPNDGIIFYLDIFVTFIFSLDIFINLWDKISKKKDKNNSEPNQKKFFLSEFVIDLLAAVPFDIIFSATGLSVLYSSLRLFRLLRIFKLIRLAQFMQRIRRSNLVNPSILRLSFLIFWMFFVAHFISCGWMLLDPNGAKLDYITRYIKALYWTVTTLTTIGYGDITPSTNTQTIYVMIIEMIGAGMYGFIIANIASLIANIDIAKAQYREKLEKINTFMKYRNLPQDLQVRINDYYSYLWENRKGYDESSVLSDLPISLKTHVSLFLNQEIIEKVPIFQGAGEDLIREIILNLEPVIFTPNDFIFKKGEVGHDMYFISKGSVDVVSEDGKLVYATLSSGQFFGEIAILLSQPRTASIRAAEYCDLYRLKKEDFNRVIRNFPDFHNHIRELAKKRQDEISSS